MPEYGEPLSEREIELLRLVSTGVTNREVAQQLSISINTVKVHLRNVYTKLGAESRTEATMIAVREGWVTVEGGEGETAPELEGGLPAPTVVPAPPLPWFKRIALVAAVPLMVAAVAVTQPYRDPQPTNGPALPLDESGEQPPVALTENVESRWQEHAQMPTRRAYLAVSAVAGRILAIAGQTAESASAAVEIYDPGSDIWERGSNKPTPVTYVSAATVENDVYVPGGCDAAGEPTQTVEVYDAAADEWRSASPLPEPRCAYGLAAHDGVLYLFGGWNGERYVATVYAYEIETDLWTELAPLAGERGFAAATPLENRLYVVGGYDGERELTACSVYDPATAVWEACAPLAVGRGGMGLVNLGNELYAIGGGGWTTWLGFSERYDPNNDAWKTVDTPLVGEWRSPGVVVFDTSIYAIGGWSGDYLSLNQEYKPRSFHVFIPVSSR